MTGGFGEGPIMQAEVQSLRSSTLVTESLGEQWGEAGLFATINRTTTLLGTRQGYWVSVVSCAEENVINLVANRANPGGSTHLSVDASKFDFSTAAGRQAFFDTYNKPFLDAAILRRDNFLMLDNPNNINAIFPGGDESKSFNFYGMEKAYLEKLGFTFSNGQAVYPMGQTFWHPPMIAPSGQNR